MFQSFALLQQTQNRVFGMRRAAGHGATEGTKCPGYMLKEKGIKKGRKQKRIQRFVRQVWKLFGENAGWMQTGLVSSVTGMREAC